MKLQPLTDNDIPVNVFEDLKVMAVAAIDLLPDTRGAVRGGLHARPGSAAAEWEYRSATAAGVGFALAIHRERREERCKEEPEEAGMTSSAAQDNAVDQLTFHRGGKDSGHLKTH